MKKYRTMVWGILAFQIIILCVIGFNAKVNDMKLCKGDTYDYNVGWRFVREDGSEESMGVLPYYGESAPDEKIVFENHIPSTYCGKTISFPSVNSVVIIEIDDKEIYSFGKDEQYLIGHSPGDVMVYADIPDDAEGKKIRIIRYSPQEDMAAYCPKICVGKRDVMILKSIESNYFDIICACIILTIAIAGLIISVFLKLTHNNDFGSMYLGTFLLLAGIYYLGESRALTIFMGNQYMSTNMVHLIMMVSPVFFLMYAGYTIPKSDRIMKMLMYLPVFNITIQAVLQLTNLVDFYRMEIISQIIQLIVLLVAIGFLYYSLRKRITPILLTQFVGVLFLTLGDILDSFFKNATIVGGMDKCGRYGTTIFAIAGAIVLLSNMVDEQIRFVEKARVEAESANKAKSQFLANMSHEIRTPINAILGLDTMILRESDEETTRIYAADIKNAGENLLALINDILDFSKIESGKMEIVKSEYDFGILIRDVMNMISTKAQDKGLDMILKIDQELPATLYGDDVRIRQILVNILSNAVKYTEKGSVTLEVSGEVEEEYVHLRYSIRDTGIGIRAEDIEKLFVQFQRVDELRNKNIEGTGLGMSIASQLLNLMDSELQINSVYGEGSDFYFDLKQKIISEEPVGDIGIRSAASADEYEYKESFVAPAAKILVVDDNTMNRNVFRALLKKTRMQIYEASSGEKCIDMCWQEVFDIIFLDHMMPEMDGIETLHKMHSIENYPNRRTPVVALTANAISGVREKYLEEGFDDFLAKPINPDKLEKMVADYLPQEYLMTEEDALEWIESHKGEFHEQEDIEAQSGSHSYRELLYIEGINWDRALDSVNDKEILIGALRDFAYIGGEHSEKLLDFYNKKDFANYRIQVHSMKTSASVIGASDLAELAKILEYAARDGDVELINSRTNDFIGLWNSICDMLKKEFIETKTPYEKLDSEKMNMYLARLENAAQHSDIDEMDIIAEILQKYSYSKGQEEIVNKIVHAIYNVEFDYCAQLVNELRDTLK